VLTVLILTDIYIICFFWCSFFTLHNMFRSLLTRYRSMSKTQNFKKIVSTRYGYIFLVMILCYLLFSQVVTMINCYCHINVLMETITVHACTIHTVTQLMYIWLYYLVFSWYTLPLTVCKEFGHLEVVLLTCES